ncbi:hypothetical protein [uncultured Flavobacterium sp.]|uniref:hypothetical protein n=1 Tax=uncultured Flavobacterium sp. TaxID=165435 RepID=UPI0025E53DCC|nr:hypothetical protein [uncultured Flavobacterium sp.]
MKKYFYTVLIFTFLFSCKAHEEILKKGETHENFRGFVPVDPIEYNEKVEIIENGKIISKEIKILTSEEIFQFLNNETVLVSIGQVNAEGGISYLPITISAKHSSYKVTMDYMKFATLPQADEIGNFIGFNRVGVGLRLITLLTTSEAGINIGDLSSIGLAAKLGKVKGTLMIEVVGIKSKEVTTLLPLPSEINQTTIQNAMQALATIKSKIYDNETKLYPQVMAIKADSTANKRNNKTAYDPIKVIMAIKPDSTANKGNNKIRYDSFEINNFPNTKNIENEIKLQIGSNKLSMTSKLQIAQRMETEAFDFLFKKKIDEAISKFDECEKTYPGFHSVYEISRALKLEKASLLNPNSKKWKEIYSIILKDYSWKLRDETLEKLKIEADK